MSNTPDSPQVLAVIPARYASTRFPAKPLALLQGKPMIHHTWERVVNHPCVSRCIVATDHPLIAETVKAFGGEVCMTSSHHPSGSDRIWEVAQHYPDYPWILNVQGDEPTFPPENLDKLLLPLKEPNVQETLQGYDVLTLVTPFPEQTPESSLIQDVNKVKALLAIEHLESYHTQAYHQALYFSRAVIPHARQFDASSTLPHWFWHMGVYLYRREALQAFTTLAPHPLECLEGLEQLRLLGHGYRIGVGITPHQAYGIDTPEDLATLERLLAGETPVL